MAHLIDADKLSSILKAQIQEREDWMNDTKNYEIDRQKQLWSDLNNEDRIILSLVNSLKQEQPEVDLEREIEEYFQGHWPGMKTAEQCNTDLHFTPPAIMRLANHFYSLGINARKEE